MKQVITYLAAILLIRLAFGAGVIIEWEWLKGKLVSSKDISIVVTIVNHWSERPTDFFSNIDEESWKKIIALLPPKKIAEIRAEEFENNPFACKAFAKYLPELSEKEFLSERFRLDVYKLLEMGKDIESTSDIWLLEQGLKAIDLLDLNKPPESFDPTLADDEFALEKATSTRTSTIIKAIPVSWVEQDERLIMETLVSLKPPLLRYLNDDSLRALLKNSKGACELIDLKVLKSLHPEQLGYFDPSCMVAIKNLEKMDLSSIITSLPRNIFAKYNGPLSKETIEKLSGFQLESYGSDLEIKTVCELLELHYASPLSFEWITPRCLYGYLSRKWEIGLKSRWDRVYLSTLEKFTPEMQLLSWVNIHPEDFSFMPIFTRKTILLLPQVCIDLNLSHISSAIIKDMSGPCLYAILSRPGPRVQLGELWKDVELELLASFSNEMMMVAIEKIYVYDFFHMQPSILNLIFTSQVALNNLPRPIDRIVLPASSKYLIFNRQQFAAIVKAAPNVAGQLLLLMEQFSEDILADCDGDSIRRLTFNVPNRRKLDWYSLIAQLEKRVELSFGNFVTLISKNSQKHLCATIKDLNEYLSLGWLRENMNYFCRSAIKFDLGDVFIFLKVPELARGMIPWTEMLISYSLDNWKKIFADVHLATELGYICKFWAIVNSKFQDIMMVIGPEALQRIRPLCVHELRDFLRRHSNFISLLADNAFATHSVDENIPCSISDLSPEQISFLSSYTISDARWPTREERSNHVLSGVTLEELRSLKLTQFKSLFTMQWTFVPESIKPSTLSWHLTTATFLLSPFIYNEMIPNEESSKHKKGIIENFRGGEEGDLNIIMDALEVYIALMKAGKVQEGSLNFGPLISIVRNSNCRDRFMAILNQFDSLRALLVGLARNSEELYNFLRQEIDDRGGEFRPLKLPFSQKSGFDRASVITLLESCPLAFADPLARVGLSGVADFGGLVRILVAQILGDIQRDLIVEGVEGDDSSKFVWGVSGEVGFLVGLLLGKVFQLNMRLSFVLDRKFFALLIDLTDETIEKYYKATYSKEISDFMQKVKASQSQDGVTASSSHKLELVEILTRPDCIRFTKLSMMADSDMAKYDFETKTNIWGCGQEEGFKSIKDLMLIGGGDDFLNEYCRIVHEKFLNEFKQFVRRMVKGMEIFLPLMQDFGTVSPFILSPFAEFLPTLLNAGPLKVENVIERVKFMNDYEVESLVENETILASAIVTAFIRSLNEGQLRHLLAVWTGTFTVSLQHVVLNVKFTTLGFSEPITIDFCRADNFRLTIDKKEKFMILPGEEYLNLFARIVKNLFGPNSKVKPDCNPRGMQTKFTRVTVCTMSLDIPLQSSQGLINSLTDVINTPITAFKQ